MWRPRWPHAWPRARGLPYDEEILRNVFSRSGFTDGYIKGVRDGTMFGVRTAQDSAAASRRGARPARTVPPREAQRAGEHVPDAEREQRRIEARATGRGTLPVPRCRRCMRPHRKKFDTELCPCAGKDGRHALFCARGRSAGADAWYAPAGELAPCAARRWKSCWPCALRRRSGNARRRLRRRWPLHCSRVPLRNVAPQAALCARFETPQQLACAKGEWKALERVLLPVQHWASVPERCAPKPGWSCRGQSSRAKASCRACLPRFRARALRVLLRKNLAHFALPCAGPWMGGFGLNVTNAAAARAYLAMGCEKSPPAPS